MGIYLCYQGIKLAWPAVLEVLDKGLSRVIIDRIASIAAQVPGVKSVHQIRSRSLSQMIVVELHIECDSKIESISEGHYIAESVIIAIKHSLSHIMDVTVHVDPEADDAVDELPFVIPTRPEIIAIIRHCHITVIDCELHYLTKWLGSHCYDSFNLQVIAL